MLQSLHVKNLALMEETEVEFTSGLNILTGETGAGKSLLIGSVNLALGGKFEKEMLRKGKDSALVELIFSSDDAKVKKKLEEMKLEVQEDHSIIISRKMQPGRSICRINGETVTVKQVKELAELLIDIHGQHEHQSLLQKKKHMEILDTYCGEDFKAFLAEVSSLYRESKEMRQLLEKETMDEETRSREQAFAEFEYHEIEEANLVIGEDEELEKQYRLMANSRKITENLSESYYYTGNEADVSAGNSLSRALRVLQGVSMYDERLEQLEEQLSEIESLLSDYNRDVAEYMSDIDFEEADFVQAEERLNQINHLKGKYGSTIEDILAYKEERQKFLQKLLDYDIYMAEQKKKLDVIEQKLEKACEKLSAVRQKNALQLQKKLKEALIHLNFLTVEFEIAVHPRQQITAKGYDEVEFLISTNPGEPIKPLHQVASGGEMSRIMLAIKTVFAGKDETDTLIFDEIDTGISGKTAWKVSEQLDIAAREHQVICITHLPQIAAMADAHFVIEKSSKKDTAITDIRKIKEEESLCELARLLGSDTLTEEALSNAKAMRVQALHYKKQK